MTPKKGYNLTGLYTNPTKRLDSNKNEFITFTLERENVKPLNCVAFGDDMKELIEIIEKNGVQNPIKIFGFFQNQSYQQNGQTIKTQNFLVKKTHIPHTENVTEDA